MGLLRTKKNKAIITIFSVLALTMFVHPPTSAKLRWEVLAGLKGQAFHLGKMALKQMPQICWHSLSSEEAADKEI